MLTCKTLRLVSVVCLVCLFGLGAVSVRAQDIEFVRQQGLWMLEGVSNTVKKNYYDPDLRGTDWDAYYREAERRIRRARNADEIVGTLFSLVSMLKDSHTVFVPPERTMEVKYGFEARFYGDDLYVYHVAEDRPAARAGLKVGDQILSISGYKVVRPASELTLSYLTFFHPVTPLNLAVKREGAAVRTISIRPRVRQRAVGRDLKYKDLFTYVHEGSSRKEYILISSVLLEQDSPSGEPGEEDSEEEQQQKEKEKACSRLGYLKLPSFYFGRRHAHRVTKHVDDYDVLIVDLRGNPGGAKKALGQAVGYFETEDVQVGEEVRRDKREVFRAEVQNPNFTGPMIILTDSRTASAAEIFARHFQRRGRAVVVGDRTAGKVVVSKYHGRRIGADRLTFYGVYVSEAQLLMPGGENLEGQGVTPDVLILPTGEDLREGRDPVFVRARELGFEKLDAMGVSTEPFACE